MTNNRIQTIEELSLNALPCLQQILDDGWVLRFAAGYTKRGNSVTPLYPSVEDLTLKIKRCEDIYHRFDLQPIFRLTNESKLGILNRTLDDLGYQKQDLVSVRVKDIGHSNFSANNAVTNMEGEISD
jgi:N-acetylglutamate synthase